MTAFLKGLSSLYKLMKFLIFLLILYSYGIQRAEAITNETVIRKAKISCTSWKRNNIIFSCLQLECKFAYRIIEVFAFFPGGEGNGSEVAFQGVAVGARSYHFVTSGK